MDTSYLDAVEKTTQRTRNYAKRQLTWLRTYFSNNNVCLTANYTQINIQQLCKTLPCLFSILVTFMEFKNSCLI